MLAIVMMAALASPAAACRSGAVVGDDEHFWRCHVTAAEPEAVWSQWVAVERWPQWDTELRAATMRDPLTLGARGVLRPRRGPKARFRITQWDPGQRYAFTTRLPFGAITVTRYFLPHDGGTAFVHDVRFTGPARRGFARRWGPGFHAALPGVMAALAAQAERRSP